MKVRDAMTDRPYYCQPGNNLGSQQSCCGMQIVAVSLWGHGIVPPAKSAWAKFMSGELHSCGPDDDIHIALQTMREAKIRRLPVMAKNGTLVGVLSMDDVLFRAEPRSLGNCLVMKL
jgi:CBS domain-containing protein